MPLCFFHNGLMNGSAAKNVRGNKQVNEYIPISNCNKT